MIVMNKEEYIKNYEMLEFDFWSYDMNGKVARLNELIDGGYITNEIDELNTFIGKWNLRCCKLLRDYDRQVDKKGIESPEKYIFHKYI